MSDLAAKHCVPCEGGDPPLTTEQENEILKQVQNDKNGWFLILDGAHSAGSGQEHKLRKVFTFKDFKGAMTFVNKIADIAESEGHHPDIYIFYNKVRIELYTHAVGGLSENDFIMASKIDALN
jgi:4a-hydroxytetrahydrobiopterin dehydratase